MDRSITQPETDGETLEPITIFELPDRFHRDPRGWAFFPFQGALDIIPAGCDLDSFHVVMTMPGAVRGNHRHPESAEWMHVFGGPVTLYWDQDGQTRERVMKSESCLIHIPAGTAHAVKNHGPGPIYLAAFREKPVGAAHTVPAPLL